MILTGNGGFAAVGTELDPVTTTREERLAILAREERLREQRKAWRVRRKTPEYMKPGPVTLIQF